MTKHLKTQVVIDSTRKLIEKHYQDKFTYAIPTWARLTADPEILEVIPLHGLQAITICKQKVDFKVDFKDIKSIKQYVSFLNNQMDISLDIIGYVVFLNKQVYIEKAPSYHMALSQSQNNEIDKYNLSQEKFELIILYLNNKDQIIENLDQLLYQS